jgi:hypothetical protein
MPIRKKSLKQRMNLKLLINNTYNTFLKKKRSHSFLWNKLNLQKTQKVKKASLLQLWSLLNSV